MRIEIVKSEIIGLEKFTELSPGIYRRDTDGAVLIVGEDGSTAAMVTTTSQPEH